MTSVSSEGRGIKFNSDIDTATKASFYLRRIVNWDGWYSENGLDKHYIKDTSGFMKALIRDKPEAVAPTSKFYLHLIPDGEGYFKVKVSAKENITTTITHAKLAKSEEEAAAIAISKEEPKEISDTDLIKLANLKELVLSSVKPFPALCSIIFPPGTGARSAAQSFRKNVDWDGWYSEDGASKQYIKDLDNFLVATKLMTLKPEYPSTGDRYNLFIIPVLTDYYKVVVSSKQFQATVKAPLELIKNGTTELIVTDL